MTSTAGLLRILPPILGDARRPQRLVERSLLVYRRGYLLIISGLFEPIFYLLSMKVGLGSLVGEVTVGGRVVDYATFVAPALMASSAMNGAIFDSTFNVFHKLKYAKVYDAMLATPLGTADIALGEIAWAVIRGLLYSASFLVVVVVMGVGATEGAGRGAVANPAPCTCWMVWAYMAR